MACLITLDIGVSSFAIFFGLLRKIISGYFFLSLKIFKLSVEKIILSRDFFGEKPLFFSFKNNEFIFGSEINYLFFFNKNLNKINDYKIGDYLINGYKSLFKNNETYFEDINFVAPGSIIELNLKNFSLKKNKIDPFLKVTVSKNHDTNYKLAKELFLKMQLI